MISLFKSQNPRAHYLLYQVHVGARMLFVYAWGGGGSSFLEMSPMSRYYDDKANVRQLKGTGTLESNDCCKEIIRQSNNYELTALTPRAGLENICGLLIQFLPTACRCEGTEGNECNLFMWSNNLVFARFTNRRRRRRGRRWRWLRSWSSGCPVH